MLSLKSLGLPRLQGNFLGPFALRKGLPCADFAAGLLACAHPPPLLPEGLPSVAVLCGFVTLTAAGPHRIFTGFPWNKNLSAKSSVVMKPVEFYIFDSLTLAF